MTVHKLRGTFDAKKHGNVPQPDAGEPPKPAWLSPNAGVYWGPLVALLSETPGLLTIIDGHGLAALCDALHEIERCDQLLADLDATSIEAGRVVRRRNAAFNRLAVWSSKFGLSPSDRACLKISPRDEIQADPFAEYA